MDDKEKIKAAIAMLKQLKKMVGFFMKKEIGELIEKLERPSVAGQADEGCDMGRSTQRL